MNDTTLANLRALEKDLGPEFLTELLDLYFNDTKSLLSQLEEAVKAADTSSIAQIAHSIKGSSANLRMEQMAEVSARIERLAKAGKVGDSQALFPELEREFKDVSKILEPQPR
ncbi:MAG TPA: Hpt domain-containing protein [Blastocatellia bacterium]|nr:Hpt domain-containing protein [Blastocatellia bacterium]